MTLGLGIWTLSQKWYYFYLVQDTVYKVVTSLFTNPNVLSRHSNIPQIMIVTVVVTGTMIGGLGCLGVLARSKPLLTLVISSLQTNIL